MREDEGSFVRIDGEELARFLERPVVAVRSRNTNSGRGSGPGVPPGTPRAAGWFNPPAVTAYLASQYAGWKLSEPPGCQLSLPSGLNRP
jgi:hypothetical protein